MDKGKCRTAVLAVLNSLVNISQLMRSYACKENSSNRVRTGLKVLEYIGLS